tara:strand:- start:38800 stop:41313 length:2514 start_codon:yes stop_codon:yes gene_type:complete
LTDKNFHLNNEQFQMPVLGTCPHGITVETIPVREKAADNPRATEAQMIERLRVCNDGPCEAFGGATMEVNSFKVNTVKCKACGCGGLKLATGKCKKGKWPDLVQIGGKSIADTFDRVSVINLRRRPERWQRFQENLNAIEWPFDATPEQVFAADGHKVAVPPWWHDGRGAWGCFLSHVHELERAMSDGVTSLLLLEDDVLFESDFTERVTQFIREVPEDWDGLYIGGQHLHQNIQKPTPVNEEVVRCFNVNRTHAFALRGDYIRDAYLELTDIMKTFHAVVIKEKAHIDHRLGRLHEEQRHKIYAPTKWIAGQCAGPSDVCEHDVKEKFWDGRNQPHAGQKIKEPVALVIGLHRSGSSCLAGVLHHLGVHMGGKIGGYEPTGGFEAKGLADICEGMLKFPSIERTKDKATVVKKLAQHFRFNIAKSNGKMTGGKYPHLCAMGDELEAVFDNMRLIHINRPLEVSIQSLQDRSSKAKPGGWLNISPEASDRLQRFLWERKNDFLAKHVHLEVEYEMLCLDPATQVDRVIDYLAITPTPEQRQTAIDHVRIGLNRHSSPVENDALLLPETIPAASLPAATFEPFEQEDEIVVIEADQDPDPTSPPSIDMGEEEFEEEFEEEEEEEIDAEKPDGPLPWAGKMCRNENHKNKAACRKAWGWKKFDPQDDLDKYECLIERLMVCVVRLRRKIKVEETWAQFHLDVTTHTEYIVEQSNSRWLVSILNTFADFASPEEARTAMLIVAMFEQERYWSTVQNPEAKRPMWDGLSRLATNGKADGHKNFYRRVGKIVREDPTQAAMFDRLMLKAADEEDFLLNQLERISNREIKSESLKSAGVEAPK